MMLPTHIVIGILISIPITSIYPNFTNLILLSSIFGSLLPDLDMIYMTHRKTLHPILLYLILTFLLFIIYVITEIFVIALLSIVFFNSFIHTIGDISGTGAEKYPWEQNNDKSIYSIVLNRWIKSRRYILYDGSTRDLMVLLISSILVIYYTNIQYVKYSVILCTLIGVIYTLLRKKLPDIENYLYENIPFSRYLINIIRKSRPKN